MSQAAASAKSRRAPSAILAPHALPSKAMTPATPCASPRSYDRAPPAESVGWRPPPGARIHPFSQFRQAGNHQVQTRRQSGAEAVPERRRQCLPAHRSGRSPLSRGTWSTDAAARRRRPCWDPPRQVDEPSVEMRQRPGNAAKPAYRPAVWNFPPRHRARLRSSAPRVSCARSSPSAWPRYANSSAMPLRPLASVQSPESSTPAG
jgi:hypothetical protein